MRTVTINKVEYPILATGETILIYKEELKGDLLKAFALLVDSISTGQVPSLDLVAKLEYALIKTVNPTAFKTYREFMKSQKNMGFFFNEGNQKSIAEEYAEFFELGNEADKKAEEPESTKKKENQ